MASHDAKPKERSKVDGARDSLPKQPSIQVTDGTAKRKKKKKKKKKKRSDEKSNATVDDTAESHTPLLQEAGESRAEKNQESSSDDDAGDDSGELQNDTRMALDGDDLNWWENVSQLGEPSGKKSRKKKSTASPVAASADEICNRAEELWVAQEQRATGQGSDSKFLKEVMTAGTLSDRVAAMALSVQQSPLYSLMTLQKLTAMAAKHGSRPSLLAVDALKDLYVENILPPRTLKPFRHQKIRHPDVTDMDLVTWYFEGEVKKLFAELVTALEKASFQNLEHFKMGAIRAAFELLCEKPEGEARLLSLLVNKLGDPVRKVAAKSMHLLQKLSAQHPNMLSVIIAEIKQFMHRPNVSDVAQYYSILFLNQIFFRPDDAELAKQVVIFYFQLFKRYMHGGSAGQKGKGHGKVNMAELSKKQRKKIKLQRQREQRDTLNKSRHLSALLTGINRAFPYASDLLTGGSKDEQATFEEHLDTLFKLSHIAPLGTGIQALTFLFQIVQSHAPKSSGRKQQRQQRKKKSLPGALLRRRSKDNKANESAAPAPVPAGVLALQSRFYRALYQRLLAPELWGSRNRLKLVLNLLFRAMKYDPSDARVSAFLKRLLQVSVHGAASLSCGSLYLASAVLAARPRLHGAMLGTNNEARGETTNGDDDDDAKDNTYDPSKREPLHAAADRSSLWEMALHQAHYHPSVGAFCSQMQGTKNGKCRVISYAGDPLVDFSLTAFLNRFSYKKPKAAREDAEEVEAKHSGSSRQLTAQQLAAPVDSGEFLNQPIGKVRTEEMFFYQFFTEKARLESQRPGHRARNKKGLDADAFEHTADDRDAEMEAFAQKLAEDLMEDADADADADGEDDFDMLDVLSSDGGESDEDGEEDAFAESGDKDSRRGLFAAAEEFAELMQGAGSDGKNAKQVAWEKQKLQEQEQQKQQKQQHGGHKRKTKGRKGGSKRRKS